MAGPAKESLIQVKVGLNANNIPTTIHWKSDDNPNNSEFQESKAFSLLLFDKEHRDTVSINLWTTEMQISEMDRFVYNAMKALADTYHKATNNTEMANQMQQFIQFFGKKTEILTADKDT